MRGLEVLLLQTCVGGKTVDFYSPDKEVLEAVCCYLGQLEIKVVHRIVV